MNKELCSLAAAVALGISNLALAQEDTPPTVPTNVTAARYDGAGAEVFWNRSSDDRGVQGYEVLVNGQSVGVLDATSYYDASLQANTAYTFSVTAIDSAGQRSGVASTTLDLDNGATGGTASPSAPANLTASVYSSTSAELFWARSDVPGLQYEVRIDGSVVATSDGTSYFTDELLIGRSYNAEVIAIDAEGQRSVATTVAFTTGTGGSTSTPGTDDTFASITPNELSIQVYSSTAAELFWTPSPEFSSLILRNEIRRNGVLIATLQGGGLNSFFDDTREADTAYTYVVTAIAEQGSASAQLGDTNIVPPTESPTPSPDIPVAVQANLATAFDVINGDAAARITLIIDQLSNEAVRNTLGFIDTGETAFTSNEAQNITGRREAAVIDCPNGGQILDSENRVVGSAGVLQAVDCAAGSVVFSFFALVALSDDFSEGFNLLSIKAENIELYDQSDLSTTTIGDLFVAIAGPGINFSMQDVNVERSERSYSLVDAFGADQDTRNRLPDGSLGLTAFAQEINGIYDGATSLSTLGPLESTDESLDGQPVRGRVEVVGGNDSLLIDASNGDPASFALTVTSGGATTSYTVPFSSEYRFRSPFTSGAESGL